LLILLGFFVFWKLVCHSLREWRANSVPCKLISSSIQLVGTTEFYAIPQYKNKFFLTQKYVEEGYSARQIAQEIVSSKTTVTAALAKFDIPIREQHLPHGHPSQPKFGEQIRKGRSVVHLVEQRVIETVRKLKVEGLSLRKIAEVLDQMKVPTKERGKKWHPEMVRRILAGLET
jgi:hypothetical protein